MSQFAQSWLAGVSAGGEQASRRASMEELIQRMQLAREDQGMQQEAQGWRREDRGYATEDRNRGLVARSMAQRYLTAAANKAGVFDMSDEYGNPMSDVMAYDSFAQMEPAQQSHVLQQNEQMTRWREQNDARIEAARVSSSIKRRLRIKRIGEIEADIRPKFGDEFADQMLEELTPEGDYGPHSLSMLGRDPVAEMYRSEPEYRDQIYGPGGEGPPNMHSPLVRMTGKEFQTYETRQRANQSAKIRADKAELTDEEADAQARNLMASNPQMTYTRAIAQVHNRHDGLVNQLASSVTGREKRVPVHNTDEYKAAEAEEELAQKKLQKFERNHKDDVAENFTFDPVKTPKNVQDKLKRLRDEHAKLEDEVDALTATRIKMLRSAAASAAGSDDATRMTEEQAINKAFDELGDNAPREAIDARKRQLMGGKR